MDIISYVLYLYEYSMDFTVQRVCGTGTVSLLSYSVQVSVQYRYSTSTGTGRESADRAEVLKC